MTTREQALIDEIVAHGGVLCETRETLLPDGTIHVDVFVPEDESEDAFLAALVDEGFEDDVEAARAALEDMGEDPSDWIALD